jgi:rhodanese-related sulfurtransferase
MFGFGPSIESITTDRLAERLKADGIALIDVREPWEYAEGHIEGATNIPLGQLTQRMAAMDSSAETYVICAHGNRSVAAVKTLRRAGFDRVYNVKGGTAAWSGKLVR